MIALDNALFGKAGGVGLAQSRERGLANGVAVHQLRDSHALNRRKIGF